ncbi:MAG: hypothetical protein RBR86_01720 [Pseudobdellovibrionaceae bacterium]|jgi:hypothetical protein|nr:hypothetical protein [Pseudobdellovibrionaceae bacterium]
MKLTEQAQRENSKSLVIRFGNATTGPQVSFKVTEEPASDNGHKTYQVMAGNGQLMAYHIEEGTIGTLMQLSEWGNGEAPREIGKVRVSSLTANGPHLTGIAATPEKKL